MYTYSWYHWITFFYLYCFFGWIFESAYVSLRQKRFVNRGFLRLPLLPLYGTGAVMMLWVSLPVKNNLVLVYLSGFFAATVLEYVTGWAMEQLFKMRYWDYSDQRFQINGYVCLSSSIAWGFLTILMTEILHKPVERLVLGMRPAVEFSFLAVISVPFVLDAIQSVRAALDLGRAMEAMTKAKAELEDLQVQIALLRAEASVRAANFRGDVRDWAGELRTDAKVWASDLKETALERASAIREEAVTFREEIREQIAPADGPELTALLKRLDALKEKHLHLSRHMGFYRKGLLRGNPSANSRRFSEALKELKHRLENE